MPALVDEMFAPFGATKAQGTTVLLVEQNVELALDIADPTDVLDRGAVVYHAAVSELWPTMRSRSVIARCDAVLQRDGQIVNAQRHKTTSPVLISINAFCLIGEMLGLTSERLWEEQNERASPGNAQLTAFRFSSRHGAIARSAA